jgi:hypothetical protein
MSLLRSGVANPAHDLTSDTGQTINYASKSSGVQELKRQFLLWSRYAQ